MSPFLPIPQTAADLASRRESLQHSKKSMVLTNGCFDLLHAGHLYFLQEASKLADELWIGLNSDSSVRSLKGQQRPILPEQERAYALSCLRFVDAVFVFTAQRVTEEILTLKPDVYAKAGDYTIETIDKEEKAALQSVGTTIRFVPFADGFSTTSMVERIRGIDG